MGFGIAVALALDATLVRLLLIPAAMRLLGERNWYLPRWLAWLPNVQVEGTTSPRRSRPTRRGSRPTSSRPADSAHPVRALRPMVQARSTRAGILRASAVPGSRLMSTLTCGGLQFAEISSAIAAAAR